MMTNIEELSWRSAADIGRALSNREARSVELTEYLLSKIQENLHSNVFLNVTRDRALVEARAADDRLANGAAISKLDGVPISWKDLFDLEGESTTAGSKFYRNAAPATEDAALVKKAAAAGMVTLGKVNLTEFAYSGLGLNPHFGTPANPNDAKASRAPGGSSSGSGVSVACGYSPCSIGTDTGGSVRIPSAFNGLVGFKSSEGRYDKSGLFALSPTLDTVGPLARSVEDCQLIDALFTGAGHSSKHAAPVARSLKHTTLFVPESVVLDDLDIAVAENFETSLRHLETAGAKIYRRKLRIFDEAVHLAEEHGTITAAEAYFQHKELMESTDIKHVDRRVVARILKGRGMTANDFIALRQSRVSLANNLSEKLDGAILVMPTTPITAPEIAPLDADDGYFNYTNLKTLRNTMLGNFLNLCGLALPNGTDKNNLPTSILFSAPAGSDELLLECGPSFENAVC
ncbi:amidase family protein [Sneathiella marina]|uniref:Amidase family protein n=1 Tax=Sneathiella marina TaxID=2950108 RepID=A0ABY4W333_9PROT|nr:amidase family protein [Sneathiella marina]USG61610.1 amidase family protein [Sneathiella marina]